MLLFSFSIFSDHPSIKIENENNNMKTVMAEVPYIGLESLEFSLLKQKLTLAGWNYLGLEFLLCINFELSKTEGNFSWISLLTHCILVNSCTVKCWMSPFIILGVWGLLGRFYSILDGKSY